MGACWTSTPNTVRAIVFGGVSEVLLGAAHIYRQHVWLPKVPRARAPHFPRLFLKAGLKYHTSLTMLIVLFVSLPSHLPTLLLAWRAALVFHRV